MFVKLPLATRMVHYLKSLVAPRPDIVYTAPEPISEPVEEQPKPVDYGFVNYVFHSVNQALWLSSCYENIVIYIQTLAKLEKDLKEDNKIPLTHIHPNMYQASEWFIHEGVVKQPKVLYKAFVSRIESLQKEVDNAKLKLETSPNFIRSRSVAQCDYILSNAIGIIKELEGVRTPK